MLIALHLALNDSTPAQMLSVMWPQITVSVFTPSSFTPKMVTLLKSLWQNIWMPKGHEMGYTAMLLPQCSEKGKRGTIQYLGADYMSRVAAALRRV